MVTDLLPVLCSELPATAQKPNTQQSPAACRVACEGVCGSFSGSVLLQEASDENLLLRVRWLLTTEGHCAPSGEPPGRRVRWAWVSKRT